MRSENEAKQSGIPTKIEIRRKKERVGRIKFRQPFFNSIL